MLSGVFKRENFEMQAKVELKETFDLGFLESSYSNHHDFTYEETDTGTLIDVPKSF